MYKHLTSEERHYIAIGIKQGMPKNKIAQHLNRSHSTIIREIKRNTDKRGYRYNQADGFAQQRHQAKSKFIKLTIECKRLIDNCLNLDWSPDVAITLSIRPALMFEVLIQQAAISLIFKQITIDTFMVQLGDIITRDFCISRDD
jgi:IS30 family transposase